MEEKRRQIRITKGDLEDLAYILDRLDRLSKEALWMNPAFRMIKKWALGKGYWRERKLRSDRKRL